MKKISLLVAHVCLIGCVAQPDARLKKIDELGSTATSLQTELDQAKSQIEGLQSDVFGLRASAEQYQTASFDPGNPGGYSRLDSSGVVFLVSVKNVTPYVDGFRVTCNFGNPSSASFKGFKLKAKWGPRREPKRKDITFTKWYASLREKELSLTDNLGPGAWNPVTFVVAPATADEFGYLELSLTTDVISLR